MPQFELFAINLAGRGGQRRAPWVFALAVSCLMFAPATPKAEPQAGALIAAPKLLARETDHISRLDAALAPARNYAPPAEELTRVRDAAAAVKANNVPRFNEIKSRIEDPAARKLVDWIRLRSGYGEAAEYRDFLRDNPLWPDRTLMIRRSEEAYFTQGGSASSIKAACKDNPPDTGLGHAALASAFLAEGNKEEARRLAAKAWREYSIPGSLETGFLRRFGDLLDASDHRWRFDRLITDDVRWADNRADRAAFARRIIPLLPEAERREATARLAVFNKSANAKALLDAIPAGSNTPGLLFHRAQVLRKAGKIEEAAAIIRSVPPSSDKIAALDEWWAERRELAYGALKIGKPKLAYDLAKEAGDISVNPLKEQTFLAGWIAYRYLKNADDAERHMLALQKAADGPLSRAKAAYWLGRIAESRGNASAATEHYTRATREPDTFHGLLSMRKVDPKRTRIEITPPAEPTADQARDFNGQDAVKALVIARKAGLGRDYTRGFLTSLRVGLPSEAEAGMIAHLAEAIGDTQMSLRIAKAGIARGQNLITYGYPVHPFPAYRPLRAPPEAAFLLGIARQETEFEGTTVSGAGAKGILQVMTVTANHVCQDYKIKCDIPRLLSDNSYNTMIASAYIADRMEEFSGSYILGLASYNAGPGRARQWIREFGDPRDPKVDPLDWIERIPITETREYVTKVLANIQIYRARLGDEANALRIDADLVRARGSVKGRDGVGSDPGTAAGGGSEG